MIPHIDFPPRFDHRGHLVVVDQGSVDEVAAGFAHVLMTEPGGWPENPDFGVGDPTFLPTIEVGDWIAAAGDQEPRAALLVDDDDFSRGVTERVTVEVSRDIR